MEATDEKNKIRHLLMPLNYARNGYTWALCNPHLWTEDNFVPY